jgi:uncharacterized protein YjdB
MFKKILISALALILCLAFFTGCGTTKTIIDDPDAVVTGVSLDALTASIVVGSTQALEATIAPANATNKSVTWASNDTAVATVNGTGVVTGVSAGTAVVTVTTTNGSKTATCNVTVTAIPTDPAVLSVTVTPDIVTMATEKGSESQLTATVVVVGGAAQTISWASSDTSAVIVNANGRVSVVRYAALGSYTITAKSTVNSKRLLLHT